MVGSLTPTARAGHGRRPVAPLVLAVTASAVAAGAFGYQIAHDGELLHNYLVVDGVLAAVNTGLGAFLWRRVRGNPIGPLYVLSGTAYAGSSAVTAWVTAAGRGSMPGLAHAAWFGEWIYVFALAPQVTLLLLLFPDGRPVNPRWRPVAWATVIVTVLLAATFMVLPDVHVSESRTLPNPVLTVPGADALLGPLLLALGLCGLASAGSLLVRLHRSAPEQRRALAPYVGAAVVVAAALTAVQAAPALWEPVVQSLVLPLLPAAATVGLLRYRLYDVEVVLRRSLVWLALTALVAAGYALVVQAVATLLQRRAGMPESLIAVGVVAAAFQPTRVWLQALVGRLLYGHRDDPESALGQLGRTLAVAAEPATALGGAAAQLSDALALPWVEVQVTTSGAATFTVASGERPAWAHDATLVEFPPGPRRRSSGPASSEQTLAPRTALGPRPPTPGDSRLPGRRRGRRPSPDRRPAAFT